ncbi:MAG: hypothetical protein AAF293_13560 [Pseudomonadota bacterium]
MVYFLAVDGPVDLPEPTRRSGELWIKRTCQIPPELDGSACVYEFGQWEYGELGSCPSLNNARFPWDGAPEEPYVVACFDAMKNIVTLACLQKLSPRILSFWDHDAETGIEVRRKMSPKHLVPSREIFDDVLASGRLNPCTLITFEETVKQPETEYVL